MAARLYSFIDIFDASFETGTELQKIVIPMIQRDYAQGRREPEVDRVRSHFLDSLHSAVTGSPIVLDFIYGDIDETGVMTPLDGQQRLTTLFLLHWYAVKKAGVSAEEYAFLKRFSYETRYSARDFCTYLVEFTPSFQQAVSDEIVDQAWFPLDWKKDPTIASMLVMLDAIAGKFYDIENLWDKLKAGAVKFYFLPIKDMGLTDELYIKMNSRGRPLTQFEHFKAELERELRLIDETEAKHLLKKIDRDWTNLLWPYRDEDHTVDHAFLRYFKFICDIICYHNNGTPQGRSYDEFELLKQYFSHNAANVTENLQTLISYFDCWRQLDGLSPAAFLEQFISYQHEPGKVQIDQRYYSIDIFSDCLKSYADTTGRRRVFPLNRIIFLYAIICYLLHKSDVSESDFRRRLRIVNNLISNSDFEISDSEARTSGNRMPAILRQVDCIICTGQIDPSITKSFSASQLAEEEEKIAWLQSHPNLSEALFTLEDHYLLQGQISIVGLKNVAYFPRFASLFQCQLDKVDCALMATGFYGQKEQSSGRYQLGTSSDQRQQAWSNLFHRSSNIGFDETSRILVELLGQSPDFTDSILDQVSSAYLTSCEAAHTFDWRYYYIKYDIFRPGSYGKYSNRNLADTPYLFSVMQTRAKWSENTYIPFLKAADENHLSRDHMGQRLSYPAAYIECENAAYAVKAQDSDQELDRIPILQNENGIDREDRIIKLSAYLQTKPTILNG